MSSMVQPSTVNATVQKDFVSMFDNDLYRYCIGREVGRKEGSGDLQVESEPFWEADEHQQQIIFRISLSLSPA